MLSFTLYNGGRKQACDSPEVKQLPQPSDVCNSRGLVHVLSTLQHFFFEELSLQFLQNTSGGSSFDSRSVHLRIFIWNRTVCGHWGTNLRMKSLTTELQNQQTRRNYVHKVSFSLLKRIVHLYCTLMVWGRSSVSPMTENATSNVSSDELEQQMCTRLAPRNLRLIIHK